MVVVPSTHDALPYVPGLTLPGLTTLSSNELAGGTFPAVAAAIVNASHDAHRYPDNAATDLVSAIARRCGVDDTNVVVGCGSASVLQETIRTQCDAPEHAVMFAWPSFEAFPMFTESAGAAQQRVPLTPDLTTDLAAMRAGIGPDTRVILLANPHNPTGTAIDADHLGRWLTQVPPEVLVVLDEAYWEFVDTPGDHDGVQLARTLWTAGHHNVMVTRTFSKAYGMAGLRVGYGIASPTIAAAVRRRLLPFGVNRVAQIAAKVALAATGNLSERRSAVNSERHRMLGALRAQGFSVPQSQANFIWLPLGDQALAFEQHCRNYGFTVLAVPGAGVRITIGTQQENTVVLEATTAWREELRGVV